MKRRSLVALAALLAFCALAPAACRDDKSGPKSPDASVDGRGPDVPRPADAAVDRQSPADDSGPSGGPMDVAQVDTSPADVADVHGTDAGGPEVQAPDAKTDAADALDRRDTTADAGATCGPGASREMLCVTYCDGIGRFCSGGNTQYRNADECRAACNGPSWACGKPGDTSGNSLFCRLGQAALAGVGAPAMACPNAGPNSPLCK